jgi:hypothetical protein
MRSPHDLGFALLAAVSTSCGGAPIGGFLYGAGQPGEHLAEGGEIRHENVRILGMPEQTWIHLYQYKGPPASENAPFPASWDGAFEQCVDERDTATQTWPFKPITGATYIDLPKAELTGTGIIGKLDIVKTDPPNMIGNSTTRVYDFTYGGGAPGNPPMGFNGTLTAESSTPGGHYTLDIGVGMPMDYYMPDAYAAPFNIGVRDMADAVPIAAGQELVLDWTAPSNDMGQQGDQHTKKTHFNFTLFVGADDDGLHPQFICFPDVEGHQVVPRSVVDALPDAGLIVHANMGHYMEARDAGGQVRRFDLVSIFCNISLFTKI